MDSIFTNFLECSRFHRICWKLLNFSQMYNFLKSSRTIFTNNLPTFGQIQNFGSRSPSRKIYLFSKWMASLITKPTQPEPTVAWILEGVVRGKHWFLWASCFEFQYSHKFYCIILKARRRGWNTLKVSVPSVVFLVLDFGASLVMKK